MTRDDVVRFIRQHRYAVESTVSVDGRPQAAVVGIAVSDRGEIVFDTLDKTRKWANLQGNDRIAIVIGFTDAGCVQYEGSAELLSREEHERMTAHYYEVFPDGRERARSWPGLVYVHVRPTWMRHLDYTRTPDALEWDREALACMGFAVGAATETD